MMKKRTFSIIFIILLIICCCSCSSNTEREQQQLLSDNNPIDRAFTRIIDKHKNELEGNTIFMYRYAFEWQKEYLLLDALVKEKTPETSWKSYLYEYQLCDMAFEYAKKWSDSDEAALRFEGIARFYKLMAYDCLANLNRQGIVADIQANEESLYQYLDGISYSEYIPDNFDAYVYEAIHDDKYPMPVYAALPDKNISLAFAKPFGAVLSVEGEEYLYRWSNGSLTPRAILPHLAVSDYDGDGIDELTVIIYVGSGTGVSIEELHIVKLDESMQDTIVTNEILEDLLYHRLSANYNSAKDIVAVRLDNQTIDVDVSSVDKERDKEFRGLDLVDLVRFNAEGV